MTGRKYWQNIPVKGFVSRIYKELSGINDKRTNGSIKKGNRRLKQIGQPRTHTDDKCTERCPASLIISHEGYEPHDKNVIPSHP